MLTENAKALIAAGLLSLEALHPRDGDFPTVTVYRFKTWDGQNDCWHVSPRWATPQLIAAIGGTRLPDQIDVPINRLNDDGLTERGFSPPTNDLRMR